MNTLPPLPIAFGPGTPALRHDTRDYYDGWNACHAAFVSALAAQAQPATPVEIGQLVTYKGETFTVVCRGDMTNTFDLHVFPRLRSGDQWRNVPETGLTKYVQPVQPTPLTMGQLRVLADSGNDLRFFRFDEIEAITRAIERAHGIGSPGAPSSTTSVTPKAAK